MLRLLTKWAITSLALVVAAWLVPGIHIVDSTAWVAVVVTAAILGLVNAFVRPLLQFLSCALVMLTMGLFLLIINAITFSLASWIAQEWFGVGFVVDGFWPALFGSLIVSVVSFTLNALIPDEES